MKKTLIALALTPLLASAADMTLADNMQGLPADFRRYFYDSEIMVQVYLNDTPLFDAEVSMNQNGDITLLHTLDNEEDEAGDPELEAKWAAVLQQGVSVGKCEKSCPDGLMAVEYHLDNSVLKLYTSEYETGREKSAWITLPEKTPGGVIMHNDLSATQSRAGPNWGLNSSLLASLGGWAQRASFESSGSSGRYGYSSASLYELFSEKELPGSFIRVGLFTPDSDTGNVQTAGFGYDTVAGVMWGTSDALLANHDSVSAWPVYVTGRNQSVAEVWRDGRLIYTQQLSAGIQALDTRRLPMGIYDVTINIIENGQTVDSQQAQILKPQGWDGGDRRWRMNLWAGQHQAIASGSGRARTDHPYAAGGGIDILAHPRAILGFSGAATEKERQLRARATFTLSQKDSLLAQYTFGNLAARASRDADIHYYHTLPGGGSASLYWRTTTSDVYGWRTAKRQRGDTRGGTLSLRLPAQSMLTLTGQYIDTAWRRGYATDIGLTTQARIQGRDATFRFSAFDRPAFNDQRRDHGVTLGVSISLAPSSQHLVSAETGFNQNRGYSSLNYEWRPQGDGALSALGGGVSYSAHDTVLSGNASLDAPWASGEVYAQQDTQLHRATLGGNLSQTLVIGGGRMASVNGERQSMESALIVDVDADDKTSRIMASGEMTEMRLTAGRNVVPAELWKREHIQFAAQNGEGVKVFPERLSVQMNRGSVQYVQVHAVKTLTLIARLMDEQGEVLRNRYVSSDVAGDMVNAEGVLTLDNGVANRTLTVRAEGDRPALRCALPALKTQKKVAFINSLRCRPLTAGEK